jgi:hypothetical protein
MAAAEEGKAAHAAPGHFAQIRSCFGAQTSQQFANVADY